MTIHCSKNAGDKNIDKTHEDLTPDKFDDFGLLQVPVQVFNNHTLRQNFSSLAHVLLCWKTTRFSGTTDHVI